MGQPAAAGAAALTTNEAAAGVAAAPLAVAAAAAAAGACDPLPDQLFMAEHAFSGCGPGEMVRLPRCAVVRALPHPSSPPPPQQQQQQQQQVSPPPPPHALAMAVRGWLLVRALATDSEGYVPLSHLRPLSPPPPAATAASSSGWGAGAANQTTMRHPAPSAEAPLPGSSSGGGIGGGGSSSSSSSSSSSRAQGLGGLRDQELQLPLLFSTATPGGHRATGAAALRATGAYYAPGALAATATAASLSQSAAVGEAVAAGRYTAAATARLRCFADSGGVLNATRQQLFRNLSILAAAGGGGAGAVGWGATDALAAASVRLTGAADAKAAHHAALAERRLSVMAQLRQLDASQAGIGGARS